MAVSAVIYSRDNWVLTEKDRNRIQAAEIRFFRSTLGVTAQDGLSNEVIRKALKISSLSGTISKYSCFNHILRIDYRRFPRYMLPEREI
jgi:hypothetical protein